MKTLTQFRKLDDKLQLHVQWAGIRWTALAAYVGAFLGVAATFAVSALMHTNVSNLTRDPAAVNQSPIYIGFLSQLGVMLWAAATTLCFFGVLYIAQHVQGGHFKLFLLASGALSLLLTLDDAFLLHEEFFPNYLHIPEMLVYGLYLAAMLGYLIAFAPVLIRTNFLLLLFALVCFGLSISTDVVLPNSDLSILIEDSAKYSGIVFWLAYFLNTVTAIIRDSVVQRNG